MNKYKKTLLFIFLIIFKLSAQSLSIVSWNIQDFGKTKSSKTIGAIAHIVRSYDIVIIQEVVAIDPGGAQAVARLADELNRKGAKWDYVISVPTKSPPYKTERYAFLWKTKKIKAIGRGKLVKELEATIFREPFMMKFKINNKIFQILNYHSRRHDENPEIEVSALLDYLTQQNTPTILCGDFNLSESNLVFEKALKKNFLPVLHNQKTTLKRKCKSNYLSHAIDNIWINKSNFKVVKADIIDIVGICAKLMEIRKISDHLPIFVHLYFTNASR